MNKKFNLMVFATLLGFGTFGASAGNEPVNCQTKTVGQQAIYTGWAACSVNGNYLQQHFQPTTNQRQLLTQWNGSNYDQCWANVPFYKYETITRRVCDYKPEATIRAFSAEDEGTIIRVNGSDSDGSITKKELWINNVKQSSSTLRVNYPPGTYLLIKAKVTDNDGYTDEAVRSYNVEKPGCAQGPVNQC